MSVALSEIVVGVLMSAAGLLCVQLLKWDNIVMVDQATGDIQSSVLKSMFLNQT